VKLLFDQNLSHRLVAAVALDCPGSSHVRQLGLERAPDAAIWRHALDQGFCIVTRDSDSVERALIQGTPPAVICLRGANTSTDHIRDVLLRHLPFIVPEAASEALQIWEVDLW
jgi:predicted nuclease of predicted toxin-antitoxin system